ncbi:MAG: bifunctional DNA primase/polymerase [candidate division NC10 bacterium]|nr:bifunctional DNA primase/polymerase [candidate division NC10 bacterium]MDE2321577.1 bifunctional DNA primase/polymerase [candidate division NC10 bacterium]
MTGAATATMLESALDLARRGWPVFPLHTIIDGRCTCKDDDCEKSAGKHPRIAGGFTYASTVELTITHWWTRWPDANIGIATGKASGFFVVDVDPRHGGDDTLRELEAQHGELPSTVESQTGGGGFHKLFKYPGYPIKSGSGVLGSGLDIKSDGGYIVAPESLHESGQRYVWEASSHPNDVAIAEPPAWLLTMLTAKANGNGQERRTQGDWLALLQGAPSGTRYDVATQIAGHFLGIGRPVEEVEAMLLGFLSQCTPPGDAKGQAKIRRMVRDFSAKDATKDAVNGNTNSNSDPLAPLRALAESPPAAGVEAALRLVVGSLAGVDGLKRATLRQEALSILKAKKVEGPAKLVDAAWALASGSTDEGGAQPLTLAGPEPWPESVDGAALLEEIESTLTRFVILPRGAATAIALWVLHAYCLAAFAVTPILAVVSATMRCGKSTLLNLLSGLLPKALPVANITPAALFRCIEQFTPSLLIDEGDTFLTMSEELRGVLNAGHTRTAGVVRTVGEEFEPRIFKVFCPKVLAMIGKPPGTIEDRSIVIPMKRKTSGEQAQRFRLKQLEALAPLCQKSARWALDHIEELRDADPAVPDSLNDRAADNWRPLLAIADLVFRPS